MPTTFQGVPFRGGGEPILDLTSPDGITAEKQRRTIDAIRDLNLTHLAATPVGHRVTAEAEVTKVDGRRIEFKVSARDETEEIGSGTHERMVVDLERLYKRLAAKAKV